MALGYRFTFIDEAPAPAVPRFRSCPVRGREAEPEEQVICRQVACLPDRARRIHEPAPAPTPALSTGSVGHPQVCRRPCVHLAKGACHSGSACGYCHSPEHRRAIPDKRDRQALGAMCEAQLLDLIIPHLRRLTETQFYQAKPLVEVLERELAVRHMPKKASEEDIKRLERTLRRMRVSGLVGLITSRRWKGPLPQVLQEAMNSLREELAVA
ncbi:unnamed protein product [Effrenium voratum]|uniref:C3H1-type domain-containing protein n=1 Tax=Effrenium voratum TaxID=2562239 RepID=A0AA36NKT9_9DINO|nr:unnamed protein product [Effrenium voratum]CAJ1432123.1 unnamed protein product [Effrenium voratum]